MCVRASEVAAAGGRGGRLRVPNGREGDGEGNLYVLRQRRQRVCPGMPTGWIGRQRTLA